MRLSDTIVAISTPPGVSGLGVVRLSGPDSREVVSRFLRFPSSWEWTPWTVTLAHLDDVDQVLVSYFAAPRSYTAEDVVEISCHGAPVVLAHAVRRALDSGARPAGPGEFTLRAYLNGRIDLPQAEAVHDLIRATTLFQARVAARQLEGSVSRAIAPAKAQLIELIALLEAGIDFADDDVSVAPADELHRRIHGVLNELKPLIDSFSFGRLVHDGVTLTIAGRTNVGKSSLFNRLLDRDRAIVTDIPGTTRDTVSETASLAGIPVKFIDTAGIRDSSDLVERLGIERSFQAMADADLTIVLLDASSPMTEEDRMLVDRAASQGRYLLAGNKADLPRKLEPDGMTELHLVSALTGEGIPELKAKIAALLGAGPIDQNPSALITSVRQEQLLRESEEALQRASEATAVGLPHELLLLDCYAALRPLDAISGATTVDDILNRIFSTFCIGK